MISQGFQGIETFRGLRILGICVYARFVIDEVPSNLVPVRFWTQNKHRDRRSRATVAPLLPAQCCLDVSVAATDDSHPDVDPLVHHTETVDFTEISDGDGVRLGSGS